MIAATPPYPPKAGPPGPPGPVPPNRMPLLGFWRRGPAPVWAGTGARNRGQGPVA